MVKGWDTRRPLLSAALRLLPPPPRAKLTTKAEINSRLLKSRVGVFLASAGTRIGSLGASLPSTFGQIKPSLPGLAFRIRRRQRLSPSAASREPLAERTPECALALLYGLPSMTWWESGGRTATLQDQKMRGAILG